MKKYEIVWKKAEESINKGLLYGKTIDETFEECIKEMPWLTDAESMLNFMAGYLGSEHSPTIDAGIFLKKFLDAVYDGRLEWKRR